MRNLGESFRRTVVSCISFLNKNQNDMPRFSVSNPRWSIPSVFYGKWMLSCFLKEGDKDVEYLSDRKRGAFCFY